MFERQFGADDDVTTDDMHTRHAPSTSAPSPHPGRVTDTFNPAVTTPVTADGPAAVESAADDGVEPDPHRIGPAPPPPAILGPPRPRTRRLALVFVSATVGVMLVLAAVAGFHAVRVAARDGSDRSSASQPAPPEGRSGTLGASSTAGTATTSAAAAASPPTQVRLRDDGGSVTLTWHDPAKGAVPFIVAGGRRGVEPIALQTVVAGETSSTIYGLNSHYDYCFTITAVYSTEVVASSTRMCTRRLATGTALRGSGDMNRPL